VAARCLPIAAPRGAKGCQPEPNRVCWYAIMPALIPPRIVPQTPIPNISDSKPGRLRRRPEFLRVAASGKKSAIGGVVLQALKRGDDGPVRLGFTVTRKVGNAVVRNRTRRRLKEAARLVLRNRPVQGADLVLIGRDSTRKRDFQALQDDIRRALDRNEVI
jgi:ribonuclease P protein component